MMYKPLKQRHKEGSEAVRYVRTTQIAHQRLAVQVALHCAQAAHRYLAPNFTELEKVMPAIRAMVPAYVWEDLMARYRAYHCTEESG